MTCSDSASGFLLAAVLTGTSITYAQAALPATAPTTTVTPSQLPSANPVAARRALQVNWDGHLLQISADGQSLKEALQGIASRTGMRILGAPPDDRIFGTYGPAPLIDLVSKLVDGLPVNFFFIERNGNAPAELTFTARNGSATPPSAPNQYQQVPPPPQAVFQPAQQPPMPQPQQRDAAGQSNPPANVPAFTPATADTGAANGTSANPTSPNGVKTPQEIFEQLQRLRSGALKPQQ